MMEPLDGHPLHQLIPKEGFPVPVAVNIAVQIAEALGSMHHAGLAHRDLKPSNIILTSSGLVKVIDFGIVKRIGKRQPKRKSFSTAPGVAIGTPGYMSPEQIRGQAVDHRSDIFCFGILLCELLTGTHPFGAQSGSEMTAAILRDDPAAISRLPELMRRIALRCLEKKPRDRYQTIRHVARKLKICRFTSSRHR